ncbi:MAG: ComF family protein [Alphaproteobacteria bacterium]|nr:ComF family protein [Alphaproteobacteria bacterium]
MDLQVINNQINKILGLLFPSKCFACGTIVGRESKLCFSCWKGVEFISSPSCSKCDYPFEFDVGEEMICGECIKEKVFFDKALSIFKYGDVSKILIHKLKYSDKLHMAKYLAMLLVKRVQSESKDFDFIVPVPMHRKKLRRRFYNQSALISKHLSRLSGIPFLPNVLEKSTHHIPQTGLRREIRKSNVKGTFRLSKKSANIIRGKNILLVDDVYTTGATVNECSKILKHALCNKVIVATVARVI